MEHSPFLKKIATYQSVSQSVSEKAKLIRGDPPKIDFKKKGEPPKKKHISWVVRAVSFLGSTMDWDIDERIFASINRLFWKYVYLL